MFPQVPMLTIRRRWSQSFKRYNFSPAESHHAPHDSLNGIVMMPSIPGTGQLLSGEEESGSKFASYETELEEHN